MSESLILKIAALPDCQDLIPEYATPGAAAFDLRSREDVTLHPGMTKVVPTGLTMQVPEGYVALVCSRSGLSAKNSIHVHNAPGVVDEDFRGEVGVILHKSLVVTQSPVEDFVHIKRGDRVAQMMIIKKEHIVIEQVETLDSTERGEGGFGSTGIK